MKLQPTAYPAERFTFSKAGKSIVTEASDLGIRPGRPVFERLYDDAVDVGIAIRGRSGKVATFYLDESNAENEDGEVWTFRPTTETLRALPQLAGYHVTVIND